MPVDITIDPSLAGRVRLGTMVVDGVDVRDEAGALTQEIEETSRALRQRFTGTGWTDIPGVADTRALYKALGIDPTKTRPSSEALLRRILKGEALYRINSLVDAINLVSLKVQLPFGLYDLDPITPPITVRMGGPADVYEGIRKGPVHLDGRPLLADADGPFGNPTSDSARTMVTPGTRRGLIIVFAPSAITSARLEQVLDETLRVVTAHNGGTLVERRLIP